MGNDVDVVARTATRERKEVKANILGLLGGEILEVLSYDGMKDEGILMKRMSDCQARSHLKTWR
jgi:hypothetical protein